MKYIIWLLVIVCAASAVWADEVDDLIGKVKPPARFADHVPNFHATQQEFTFSGYNGPEKKTFDVIMDGDRYVALYDRNEWMLDVITFDPTQAPTAADLKMPHRYSWVTLLGTRISTCVWYDGFYSSGDEKGAEFTGGGKTLTFTAHETWTKKRTASSQYVFVLRCDPVLGYVFDITTTLASSDAKGKGLEFLNVQPGRMADPWPDKWQYDATLYTPLGSDKVKGWWNNLVAADRSDQQKLLVRPTGWVGFFTGRDGWAPVISRVDIGGARAQNATCNYWEDQHNILVAPDTPGADGLYHIDAKWRFLGFPPEMANAALQSAEMMTFGGWREVQVRLGVPEDFEDQPLPMTTKVRGLWNWGMTVTEEQAHGGKKALLVKGATPEDARKVDYFARFIAPMVSLDPNSTYHLESWILVDGDGTEAYISTAGSGAALLNPDRIGKSQTAHVKAGEGWKQVSLDLVTGAAGGSVDLRFLCFGPGKAYFDDFSLIKVK